MISLLLYTKNTTEVTAACVLASTKTRKTGSTLTIGSSTLTIASTLLHFATSQARKFDRICVSVCMRCNNIRFNFQLFPIGLKKSDICHVTCVRASVLAKAILSDTCCAGMFSAAASVLEEAYHALLRPSRSTSASVPVRVSTPPSSSIVDCR